MLEEVDSNDVKLNICKEESPGVVVAAKNDGQPPLTPAGDLLTVSCAEKGASWGLLRRMLDDAVGGARVD